MDLYIWIQRIDRWCKTMFYMNDALWTCVWTPQLWLGLKPCLQMSRVHNHGWWFYTKDMLFFWHIWVRCNNKRSGRWDPEIPIAVVLNNAVLRQSWERPNGTCPQWMRTFSGSKNKQRNGGISCISCIQFLSLILFLSTESKANASWTRTPTVVTVVMCCHVGIVQIAIVHTVSAQMFEWLEWQFFKTLGVSTVVHARASTAHQAGEEANEAVEASEQKDEQAAEDESKDSDEELVQL